MTITLIFIILFGHYIGDFILQTDWEATNKSKNIGALTSHVGGYSIALTFTMFALIWALLFFAPLQEFAAPLFAWVVFNTVVHFIVDYYTSQINSNFLKMNDNHRFFAGIGLDQMIHEMCLLGSFFFLVHV